MRSDLANIQWAPAPPGARRQMQWLTRFPNYTSATFDQDRQNAFIDAIVANYACTLGRMRVHAWR